MRTLWIGAALAAVCLTQAARGQAPPGAGAMPEPAPLAACPPQGGGGKAPSLTPGPLTGAVAPPGPDDGLSLPPDVPTAWGKGPLPESAFYFNVGAMGLQRQRPGHNAIALQDNTTNNLDNGFIPLGKQTSVALDTHQLDPSLQWGVRYTFGYLCDDSGIEVSGFYLAQRTNATAAVANPGKLLLFFQNPPVGFEGDNGMWLQVDQASESVSDALGNIELNYRWWSRSFTGFEGILGVRYVDLDETARIYSGDDDLTVLDVNGLPDPARQATYLTRAHNHLVMGQMGFEWNMPIFNWLSLGVTNKNAFGANFADVTTRLTRGDGFVGREGRHNEVTYAGLCEMGAFFDFIALERVKIRAGYNVMWLLHVDEALQQVNYDLANQPGQTRDNGSIFFHGPMVEVQFLF